LVAFGGWLVDRSFEVVFGSDVSGVLCFGAAWVGWWSACGSVLEVGGVGACASVKAGRCG